MRLALPLLLISCSLQIPDDLDGDSFLKLFEREFCAEGRRCGSVICDFTPADFSTCSFNDAEARACLEGLDNATCDGVSLVTPDVCNRVFDCGSPQPTGPSDPLEAAAVIVSAAFFYDADTDAAVEGVNNGVALPPEVAIIVAEQAWNGDFADTEGHCITVIRGLAPSPRATWTSSVGGNLFGFEVRSPGVVATTCDGNISGYDITAEELAALSWQMGILGEVDDSYWTGLVNGGAVRDDERNDYIGGYFAGDLGTRLGGTTGRIREVLGNGFATDGGVLRIDNGEIVPLDRGQMSEGGELQSGFYSLQVILPPEALDVLR